MGSLGFKVTEIREVRRFCNLLDAAKMAGEPHVASTSIVLNEAKATRRGSKAPPDAPRGPNYRRLFDRYCKRIASLADDLEVDLAGGERTRRGWQCSSCGRFQRQSAQYCDRCATPRDDGSSERASGPAASDRGGR